MTEHEGQYGSHFWRRQARHYDRAIGVLNQRFDAMARATTATVEALGWDRVGPRTCHGTGRNCRQVMALATLLSTGCVEAPSSGRCPNIDDPVLSMTSRRGLTPLADGDELDVFAPPQGGVFTELDVSIVGVTPSDLERLDVTVESTGSLGLLASVSYLGNAIPMWCSEDDVLEIDNLPVGFEDAFGLPDLLAAPGSRGSIASAGRRTSRRRWSSTASR